ncbi:LRR receptor-like serine/threonine-protein kinase ERECTA [Cornus florida]|uniref:LRR receptor-like serine/threonine-protein kinase ERECTA n=1 Tax=Cornus florida TaxID=4283 RepID=UPI0028A00B20|nr:LRR receptor-like serine/threonine-protein kinase ERECTA [Cornus florida]
MLSEAIPPILGNLTYTEKLYLHGNKLIGSIPPELGNMTKLHYLELNDNQLTGYIPPELVKLTDLFDLNVANNKLVGPYLIISALVQILIASNTIAAMPIATQDVTANTNAAYKCSQGAMVAFLVLLTANKIAVTDHNCCSVEKL